MKRGVFVSGTDTGIGKTVAAALLARDRANRGETVGVMKPVETGCMEVQGRRMAEDAAALKAAAGCRLDDDLVVPYRLALPASPHLAAQVEGLTIEADRILDAYQKVTGQSDFTVVEGAGGLLVPLNDSLTMAGLARLLELPVLLVSHSGLGTINQTLLSIQCLEREGVLCAGVILNTLAETDPRLVADNRKTIESRGGVPVLGVVPQLADRKLPTLDAATAKIDWSALRLSRGEDPDTLERIDRECIWHPFTQMRDYETIEHPIVTDGDGNRLRDVRGNWYIDGVSSLWTNMHGHHVPALDSALIAQAGRVAHSTLLGMGNVPSTQLADKLVSLAPDGLTRVFYSDNGSTAMEVALKIALHYWRHVEGPDTKRTQFVTLENAYHGDTIGSVSLGGIELFHETYRPLLFETLQVPNPDRYHRAPETSEEAFCAVMLGHIEKMLEANRDTVAAVSIEPLIQGAAGIVVHPRGFARGVRRLCDEYGVLMLTDEVAVGMGRMGTLFACEQEGYVPDMLAVAKGLGGGYLPVAATLTSEAIYQAFLGEYGEYKTLFHGHTFTGNPLACAVALANLELIEQNRVLENVNARAEQLQNGLEILAELPHVGDARGRGLMAGIELVEDKAKRKNYPPENRTAHKVTLEARKHGVLLRPLGDVVIICPPLSITAQELAQIITATHASIRAVTEG